jgi:dTDP-4-amino-4,6-dideoxygalactose transaminase
MNMKKKEVPFSEPYIDEQEVDEVVKVLRSKWITTGAEVKRFEEAVKQYIGSTTAVAVSSCTAALDISLSVHGVGPGDQVLTTAYTFASTTLSIVHRGADPVFVDVEPDTFNIDPAKIADFIESGYQRTALGLKCKQSGKILRGILVVHFAGQPVELKKIAAIAKEYDLFVVEDAAHAIGAVQDGVKIGKSENFVCFSFYSNKNVTTGEGGMIVTDKGEYEKKLRMLSLHGISKSNRERYQTGLPFYDVELQGFKANLTDIQAALGVIQIGKLNEITNLRNRICQWYNESLMDVKEVVTPVIRNYNDSACHLYPLLLAPKLKPRRDDIIIKLREKGIYPSVHFIPVHFHSFFKKWLEVGECVRLPVCEDLFYREISLPLFPGMKEEDAMYVTDVLRGIVGGM